jgi:hypothetical protein
MAPRCGTRQSGATLDESIEELRQIADGHNDILAGAAGKTAGLLVCLAVDSHRA